MTDYAKKWFAQDPEARADEADAFLAESESVPDLRTNPLLLSLMCILYRGEGSLPRDRAGVYAKCAELLLHKWDERRRIRRDLRADHLVEPTLRNLAWWMFTRDETQAAVTERELIIETATFLHGRGFESKDDALVAAREFVEFSRGRMWVFSDAGTTSAGEKLYAFTHRTFLEYFTAAHLAYDSDTPERLARKLAPHIARGEWEVVGELAVQIKDGTSTDGARRIYAELLGERRRRSPNGRSGVLQFLARTLRSVEPPPQTIRTLTNETLRFLFSGDPNNSVYFLPLAWLLASCVACQTVVDEEVSRKIATLVASGEPEKRLDGLRFAASLDGLMLGRSGGIEIDLRPDDPMVRFWQDRKAENMVMYAKDIIAAASDYTEMRSLAVEYELITVERALEMKGGLLPLLQGHNIRFLGFSMGSPLMYKIYKLVTERSDPDVLSRTKRDIAAVGKFISLNPRPPWVIGSAPGWSYYYWGPLSDNDAALSAIDSWTYLGVAVVVLISAEFDESKKLPMETDDPSRLGPFSDLYAYMHYRQGAHDKSLPELPLPDEFKEVFRNWAKGAINLTAPS